MSSVRAVMPLSRALEGVVAGEHEDLIVENVAGERCIERREIKFVVVYAYQFRAIPFPFRVHPRCAFNSDWE